MKQNMKTILKLFTFSTIFILFACSEDFYDNAINKNDLKVSHKKFEELLKEKNFNKVFTEVIKFKNKISSNSKTVMEQQYGFNITDKPINVIENENITSYTLFVTRENNPNNIIENLIIQTNNSNPNDTKAFLFKYISNVDIDENFNISNFQGTKYIVPIVYNINESNETGKLIYIETCWTVTSWYCYGPGEHSNSTSCTMGFPITGQNCITSSYDDGSGGGGGDDGISSGGGGSSSGSGGSSSGDVFTAPHGGGGGGLTLPNPCVKLKKLFDPAKANIKPKIVTDLQPNIAVNPSGEKGVSLAMNSSSVPTNTVIPPTSTNSVGIPTGGNYYSGIHTHPLDTFPMFSWSDVAVLNTLNNSSASHNQGLASFLLVCQDDNNVFQTYAIVFDPDSLNDTIDQFMGNPENNGCTSQEIELKMNNLLGEEYFKDSNYERAFLKFMSSSNVSLYRANSTLTNWSKLSLSNNSATATVNSTNCN